MPHFSRTIFLKTLLAVALVVVFVLVLRTGHEEIIVPLDIVSDQSIPQVTIEKAHVVVRDGSALLNADIYNQSDIPVTLVVVDIICGSDDTLFERQMTLAQERSSQGQYVAVRVPIGEVYTAEMAIPEPPEQFIDCRIAVDSWSRYGADI